MTDTDRLTSPVPPEDVARLAVELRAYDFPDAARTIEALSRTNAYLSKWRDTVLPELEKVQRTNAAQAEEIERLKAVLNYVADHTFIGADANWHFKSDYDPQLVIDCVGDGR